MHPCPSLLFPTSSLNNTMMKFLPRVKKNEAVIRGLKTYVSGVDTITLGAGCFWCVEAVYQRVLGVLKVENGYMGGRIENPSYEQVCTGETGHTEVVQIKYDTSSVSTAEILEIFFKVNDPTTETGSQYKSAIFCHTEEQKSVAKKVMESVQPRFWRPILTQVNTSGSWYPADKGHKDYYMRNRESNDYCNLVIHPKLSKIEHDKFNGEGGLVSSLMRV